MQHRLVVVDIDKKKLKKVVRMKRVVRRRLWKLKEDVIRKRYQRGVEKLVDVNAQDV